MPTFEDREKGFERKFEHDQELAFKVRSRKRRLLGAWAAGQLGLKGREAEAYADRLAQLGLHPGGDEAEIEAIAKDFAQKGVALARERIRLEAEHFDREARKELGAPK
jgi:hypothetical protein